MEAGRGVGEVKERRGKQAILFLEARLTQAIAFVFCCALCLEARQLFVVFLLFVFRRGLHEVIVGWLSCTPLAPPCPGTS